ncbi:hypothetical protein ACFL6W_05935 [Thermodesulfobacteriota bacterium]
MENGKEKRIDQRTSADLASVEFSVSAVDLAYQFKVRETSISGLSILVREDSAILAHLEEGMILEMKYYPTDRSENPQILKTKIMHITKSHSKSLKGHCLVGLQLQ